MIQAKSDCFRETRPHEYLVRFVFGGIACVIADLVAQRFGPLAGGLFLAFPAIFPASATLIEAHEKRKRAERGEDGTAPGRREAGADAAGAALGCVGLATFAPIVWRLLPVLSPVATLVIATAGWAMVSGGLWVLLFRGRV